MVKFLLFNFYPLILYYTRLKFAISYVYRTIQLRLQRTKYFEAARPAREEHPQRYWDKRREEFAIRVIKVIYRAQ